MKDKVSLRALLVGIYLFSVPVFSFSTEMALSIIPQLIGAVFAIYAIVELIIAKEFKRNTALLYYILFAIWSIVPEVFSEFHTNSEGLFTLLKVMMITVAAALLVKTKMDFVVCLTFFFISIFFTIWLNLEDILLLRTSDEITGMDRFVGTFDNSNTAALYAITVIWSGFTLLVIRKNSLLMTLIILFGILLAGFLIVYAGSKKGYLGLAMFAIFAAWILLSRSGRIRFNRVQVTAFVLIILVGVIYLIYTSPFFFRIQTMFGGQFSTQARLYLFKEALNVWSGSVKNFIMGVGIGNFMFYNSLHAYSHSTIAETLVCTGIIGFSLYFASMASIFFLYVRTLRVVPSDQRVQIWLVFIILLLIIFFNSAAVLFADRIFWPLLGIISARGVTLNQTTKLHDTGMAPYRLKFIS